MCKKYVKSSNFENILKNDLLKNSSSLELQKVINEDELIIDFEKFNEDGNVYYKSIVMANDIPPTIIDLYKDANDTIFYNQLEPYIKRYKKVYFSPSGSSLVYPLEYILRKKYKNIEFVTIDHVKLDASVEDKALKSVFNHYTVGCGPTIFKFNFLSPISEDKNKKLRNPMIASQYEIFYQNDFIINDIIRDVNDDILVLFEERSEINNNYKSTKALRFNKEMIEKTNLVNFNNIYDII